MQKTILLTRYELGPGITRFLFFAFGISQAVQGIRHLNDTPLTTGDLLFGGFLLLTGLLLFFLGFTLFSHSVPFSPKISIDDETMVVREDVFIRTKRIDWKDVKQITFKPFALDILLTNEKEKSVILRTTAEVSIEVKRLVRQTADRKGIPVIGG